MKAFFKGLGKVFLWIIGFFATLGVRIFLWLFVIALAVIMIGAPLVLVSTEGFIPRATAVFSAIVIIIAAIIYFILVGIIWPPENKDRKAEGHFFNALSFIYSLGIAAIHLFIVYPWLLKFSAKIHDFIGSMS